MKRILIQFAAILFGVLFVAANFFSVQAHAADMTFQFINDTERTLSMKLFSRAESHQVWPSKTKAYTVKSDIAVQQLKISCEEGERVCWGAWVTTQQISGEIDANGKRSTRTGHINFGTGERGVRPCEHCCHVCNEGALTPITKINIPGDVAK